MSNEKAYVKHGTMVVRDTAKQEYLRVVQLINLASDIPDDSQGMSDYLSILDCERKDLRAILNTCDEIVSYYEKPGIKQEVIAEDF